MEDATSGNDLLSGSRTATEEGPAEREKSQEEIKDSFEKSRKKNVIDATELVFALAENLLAFRIAFKFLGVEVPNIYFQLVYRMTDFIVQPFLTAMPGLTVKSEASLLEGGSIVLVFLLLAAQKLVVYQLEKK